MNTQELLEEVNRRATAFVVPDVLVLLEKRHAKGAKACTCSYCGLKAMATLMITNAGRINRRHVKLSYRKLLKKEREQF